MDAAEGQDCGRPGEEKEDDESDLFEEEDDLEGAQVSPILKDVIRHIDEPHSPESRYTEMTRMWALEPLRTCGSKALNMVHDQSSVPSGQALSHWLPPITFDQT
jgi:hypothetical protein